MKSKKILLGLLVLVLAFGMTVAACGGEEDKGADSTAFDGTWAEASGGMRSAEIVASGGNWTYSTYTTPGTISSKVDSQKGTYTVNTASIGGVVTTTTVELTITQVNTGTGDNVVWTNYGQLTNDQMTQMNLPNTAKQTGTITAGTFTVGTGNGAKSFTKQP